MATKINRRMVSCRMDLARSVFILIFPDPTHPQPSSSDTWERGTNLCGYSLVQWIQQLWILEKDLVGQRWRNVFPRAHSGDQLALLRRILMAVIRADDQVILARIFRNIFDVFIRFAGNENSIRAEHVLVRRKLPFLAEQALDNMHHERHPTRRSLDKAEFELRKLFRNFVVDQITKRKQRLNAAMAERVISFHVEEVQK